MGMKNSLRESKIATFALLLGGLWLLLVTLDVIDVVGAAASAGTTIGQGAFGGALGILVMVVILGLMVWLYGELSEPSAKPSSWPPE